MPDCKPVAYAKVSHWQGGKDGRYTDRLRAYLFTDDQGYYAFETEWRGNRRQQEIIFNMVLEKNN